MVYSAVTIHDIYLLPSADPTRISSSRACGVRGRLRAHMKVVSDGYRLQVGIDVEWK